MTGKVTKIERQENNRQRYSIYLDGKFAFGLDQEIVIKQKLAINQILTDKQIDCFILDDEKKRAIQKAYRILGRRDHSKKELSEKLQRSGFQPETINNIIADLSESKLLNDGSFARQFARNKIIQKPVGRRELAYSLKKKGISDEILELTLEEVYSEFDEEQLAKDLAKKKIKTINHPEPLKSKKKISDFLFRRGFNWEIIEKVFEEMKVE